MQARYCVPRETWRKTEVELWSAGSGDGWMTDSDILLHCSHLSPPLTNSYKHWTTKPTSMDEPQAKRKRSLAPEDDNEPERPRRWTSTEAVAAVEERGLLMDLLQSNAALMAQRDSLQQALNTAFAAFGLSQDDARDVSARLSQAHAKDSPTDAAQRPRANSSSASARSDVDRECDRRMRDASQASPFAAIGDRMGLARLSLSASETDILNAARKWPEAPSDVAGIFDLATDLFGIDHPPSNIRTLRKLEEVIQSSSFLSTAVQDLCPLASQSPPGQKASRGPLLDAIGKKKRAIIALVMESTRGWRYPSDVERAAMFWLVYRLFNASHLRSCYAENAH